MGARKDLESQLEQLGEELVSSGDATSAQIEVTKKKEGEMAKLRNEMEEAAQTAEGILNQTIWKYRVGVLSTLVTLYLAKDNRQGAAELLKDAVEWNKKSGGAKSGLASMAVVWRKTAEFHLKSGEAKVAAESLEELQKLEPGLSTLAQLVLAYAKFDLTKAMAVSKKLPAFTSGSVDVDTLESGSWAMGAKQFKKTPRAGGEKTPPYILPQKP